jgi:hypothetical protein
MHHHRDRAAGGADLKLAGARYLVAGLNPEDLHLELFIGHLNQPARAGILTSFGRAR